MQQEKGQLNFEQVSEQEISEISEIEANCVAGGPEPINDPQKPH